MRSWLTAALITLAGVTDAAAQSCTPYPETFAQGFYRDDYAFYNEDPQRVARMVTPALLKKLQDERACVEKNGRCHLAYDPWLGPIDGAAIGSPVLFKRKSNDGHHAEVEVSYPLQRGGTTQTVQLRLARTPEVGCWQLDDLVTPAGVSLAAALGSASP